MPSANQIQDSIQVVEQAPKPPTKWEELRQANSKSASTSSWDSLRQKYEKQKIGPHASIPSNEVVDEFAMKDSGDKYTWIYAQPRRAHLRPDPLSLKLGTTNSPFAYKQINEVV